MIEESIVLVLIFTFLFISILTLLKMINNLRYSEKYFSTNGSINKYRVRRKNDFYNKLLFEQTPFSWRIALALSVGGFDGDEMKRFMRALDKVLSKEKEIIKRFDENAPLNLSKKIIPFSKKDKVESINTYIEQFKAYILIEESDEDETLEYLLEDAVGNFSITFNEIQRNREMEPPF